MGLFPKRPKQHDMKLIDKFMKLGFGEWKERGYKRQDYRDIVGKYLIKFFFGFNENEIENFNLDGYDCGYSWAFYDKKNDEYSFNLGPEDITWTVDGKEYCIDTTMVKIYCDWKHSNGKDWIEIKKIHIHEMTTNNNEDDIRDRKGIPSDCCNSFW